MEMLKIIITASICSSFVFAASDTVRLIGSDVGGRLEYLHSGQWGTVCDDLFDMIDATVICRELDLGNAVSVLRFREFEPASSSTPIWLDNVECTGNENRLSSCAANPRGQHNCTHVEDVGVQCTGDTHPVRIETNFYPYHDGPLEIQNAGVWGAICADNWTSANTDVVCKQLGYESGESSYSKSSSTTGNIILDNVSCTGQEESLAQCQHGVWGEHSCTENKKLHIICSHFGGSFFYARLVGGKTANNGILEVSRVKWGTVCRNNWGIDEAEVVCRQLGYSGVKNHSENRYLYQIGNTELHPINLDNVDCTGYTQYTLTLQECTFSGSSLECDHNSDVALSCIPHDIGLKLGDIRLVGSKDKSEGFLELFMTDRYGIDRWGTICNANWGENEANTACRQLGYSYASDYLADNYDFKFEDVNTWNYHSIDFACNKTRSWLLSCKNKDFCYSVGSTAVSIRCSNDSIVDTVVGVIVAIFLVILVLWCCCRRQRQNASRTTTIAVPLASQPVQVHQPTQEPLLQHSAGYPPQPIQGYPPQPAQVYIPQPDQGYPPKPDPAYTPQDLPQKGPVYPPQAPQQGHLPQPTAPNQGYPPGPMQPSAPLPEPAELPPQYSDVVRDSTTYPPA